MKKVVLFIFVLILPFVLAGCGSKQFELEDYMSETTKVYFQAEGNGFNATLSVGEREIDYKVDGRHGETCEFALLQVEFDSVLENDAIDCVVSIDGQDTSLLLEFNPLNNCYMGDLGFNINADANVSITVEEKSLQLENVSNNFAINWQEALQKSQIALIDEISSCYSNGSFCGEGYLKLLHEKGGSFQELFWSFRLVCEQGIKYDVVIDAQTGEIVGVNL